MSNFYRSIRATAKTLLPESARVWLLKHERRLKQRPPVGWVRFGSLRRLQPISRVFGQNRGVGIDRYFIKQFLAAHSADIRGRVLEIADNAYTRQFGKDQVTQSDVIHPVAGNPQATIIDDLTSAASIPSDTFDCIICTQTLLVIYDIRAVVQTLQRILKPGGVVLVTVPGISQISRYDMDRWGDYWRFTTLSLHKLFGEFFSEANVTVTSFGNVLLAVAFLHGLTIEEFTPHELGYHDPDYQLLITVRAVK